MSWWNRLPYPIKAAIARFVRAVAAGGFSATATISIVGLEPKAAILLYASTFITGALLAADVAMRQIVEERKALDLPVGDTIELEPGDSVVGEPTA